MINNIIDYLPIDIGIAQQFVLDKHQEKIKFNLEFDLKNKDASLFSNLNKDYSHYKFELFLNCSLHKKKILNQDINFTINGYDVVKSINNKINELSNNSYKVFQTGVIYTAPIFSNIQCSIALDFIFLHCFKVDRFVPNIFNLCNGDIKITKLYLDYNIPLCVFTKVKNLQNGNQQHRIENSYNNINRNFNKFNKNKNKNLNNFFYFPTNDNKNHYINNNMNFNKLNNFCHAIKGNNNFPIKNQANDINLNDTQLNNSKSPKIELKFNKFDKNIYIEKTNIKKINDYQFYPKNFIPQYRNYNNFNSKLETEFKAPINVTQKDLMNNLANIYNCNWHAFMTYTTPVILENENTSIIRIFKQFERPSIFGIDCKFKNNETHTYYPSLSSLFLEFNNNQDSSKISNMSLNNGDLNSTLDCSFFSHNSQTSHTSTNEDGMSIKNFINFQEEEEVWNRELIYDKYKEIIKSESDLEEITLADISNDSYFAILWTEKSNINAYNFASDSLYPSVLVFYRFKNNKRLSNSLKFMTVIGFITSRFSNLNFWFSSTQLNNGYLNDSYIQLSNKTHFDSYIAQANNFVNYNKINDNIDYKLLTKNKYCDN
jgi:hypothetical protein